MLTSVQGLANPAVYRVVGGTSRVVLVVMVLVVVLTNTDKEAEVVMLS